MKLAFLRTAFFAVPLFLAVHSSPAAPAANLILILDASGSMWGRVNGETKIEAARRVVKDLVAGLPADAGLGFVAYGHRAKGDCNDIEVLLPPGTLDKSAVGGRLDKLNPVGMTPITKSFEQAVAAAAGQNKPGTIVLVTDGLETCGGDPCAAARKAKEAGMDFVLHIVGFDVSKENVSQLECAAQAGGGLYLTADDANQLSAALQQTMTPAAPAGDAKLSLKSVVDGKLHDSIVRVLNASGKEIAGARTYASEGTNPRIIPLPAGTYDVVVQPMGVQGSASLRFDKLTLPPGATVEKLADFTTGEVAVKVTRNGELSDATVVAYAPGTRTQVAGGRSYRAQTSNPRVFRLPPGEFDIAIGSVEINTNPVHRFPAVKIEPGQRLELSHDFVSGEAKIGAVQAGTLVDAAVAIKDAAGQQIAGGRTYTDAKTNPRAFTLPPGKYTALVSAVRLDGSPARTIAFEVERGSSVLDTVDFSK